MSTMTKWAVGVVAVFGLMVGSTGKATAAQYGMSLAKTAWISPMQFANGETGYAALAFNDQGQFLLMTADSNGTTLGKLTGTFQVVNGFLILVDASGKTIGHEYVVSVNDFQLVTKAEGKVTTWNRLPAK